MMNHPKVGTKNVPLILCLFSLALLFIQAVPALAANQYALVCTSCHGMPPLDSAQRDVATGAFQGNHQTHLAAGASASACVKCHANNAYTIDHPTGVINMAARINNYSAGSAGAARYNKPLFFNQTSLPVLATCSNVNCHFETKTLAWSSVMPQTPADCNFCHSFPPNVGVSGTSHATHYANVAAWGGLFGPLTCTPCHSDGGVTGQPKWTYDHATSASRRPIHFDSALGYNGSANKFLPSQAATRVLGSCATTYCHSNGVQGAGNVKVATPVWGVKTTCGSCHASPMATNAHPRHIASFGCELCHSATATNSTTVNVAGGKHTNGVVDMAFSGAAVGTV